MRLLSRINLREMKDAINEIIKWIKSIRSGDGLVELAESGQFRLNIDRVRARIPKSYSSSSGVVWAYCEEDAGTGSELNCYINISEWDTDSTYNTGTIVVYSNSFFVSLADGNKGNTPEEGEWWDTSTSGYESVHFTLLAGISNLSSGHLSLVTGTPIPVMQKGDYWYCIIPIEGTEDCS